ncbi:MAG: glycosyltransferase family 2 protein [Pseudomonadota bacterium]
MSPEFSPSPPVAGRGPGVADALSVVVPFYNEADVLPAFHARLTDVLGMLDMPTEIIYVDDGSRDASAAIIHALGAADPRVRVIRLSRNFGKEAAMLAGLDASRGAAIVLIDADLQDPPELIPAMIEAWRAGADQVEMRRTRRDGESWLKRASAFAFYRLMDRVRGVDMSPDVGDFRLMSRPVVTALTGLRERTRFTKGLYAWVGFRRVQIDYRRDGRHAGRTKWSYPRLVGLAVEAITSFTVAPLRAASVLGITVSAASFVYGSVVVVKTLLLGDPVAGYSSLMAVISFMGGVQLLCIGVLGEYVGRMFVESKQRPLYVVECASEAHGEAIDDRSGAQP